MEKRTLHQINHKKFNYFTNENKKEQITDQKTLLEKYEEGQEVFIEKK